MEPKSFFGNQLTRPVGLGSLESGLQPSGDHMPKAMPF